MLGKYEANDDIEEYLAQKFTLPFRACAFCGRNLFEFDHYYDFGGDLYCEDCITREDTDRLEMDEEE